MEHSVSDSAGPRLVLGLPEAFDTDAAPAAPGPGDPAPVPEEAGPSLEERFSHLSERFDQLEFVIVEQFEPGMTQEDGPDRGNLRDRLVRIEAALDGLAAVPAAGPEDEPGPGLRALAEKMESIAAGMADLGTRIEGVGERAERLERTLRDLAQAQARLEKRPAPVPDLTAMHQGFARFGTALNGALHRMDTVVSEICERQERIEAAIAELSARLAQGAAGSGSHDPLEDTLRDLGSRIGALAEAAAARPEASRDVAALAERLAAAEARIAAGSEPAEAGHDAALRALQTTVAELLAENRRLASA